MPYNPSQNTVSNKSYAPAQAIPTDARSFFYDASLFVLRAYQSTAEVLAYLNLPKYRSGNFPIYINDGTLSGSTFTGGTIKEFWFKDGVTDGDLVEKAGGGVLALMDQTIPIYDASTQSLKDSVISQISLGVVLKDTAGNIKVYFEYEDQGGVTVIGNPTTKSMRMAGSALIYTLSGSPGAIAIVDFSTNIPSGSVYLYLPQNDESTLAVAYDGIKANAQGEIVAPYKVYTAILDQSGASIPSAAVKRNTLGGFVIWTRVSAGIYQATLHDELDNVISNGFGDELVIFATPLVSAVYPADSNNIKMTIFNGGDFIRINTFLVTIASGAFVNTYTDSILRDTAVEFRMYI